MLQVGAVDRCEPGGAGGDEQRRAGEAQRLVARRRPVGQTERGARGRRGRGSAPRAARGASRSRRRLAGRPRSRSAPAGAIGRCRVRPRARAHRARRRSSSQVARRPRPWARRSSRSVAGPRDQLLEIASGTTASSTPLMRTATDCGAPVGLRRAPRRASPAPRPCAPAATESSRSRTTSSTAMRAALLGHSRRRGRGRKGRRGGPSRRSEDTLCGFYAQRWRRS